MGYEMIYSYYVNEDVINNQFKSYSNVIVFVCFVLLRLQLRKYNEDLFKCSSALHQMWGIQRIKPRLLYSVRREPKKDMLSFRK